jgi:endonuclease/exonuclease/phosphatase (EEP) superfamily protein YafD
VRLVVRIALVWLAASALAPYLRLDAWSPAILLAYPPRLIYAALALLTMIVAALIRDRTGVAGAATVTLLLVTSLGWGGASLRFAHAGRSPGSDLELVLLAHNVHNQIAIAQTLPALIERENVDLVLLQEVRANNRKHFTSALPGFAFFWADPAKFAERRTTGVFASMIGVRRELLDKDRVVEVVTGITDYRTFAIRASIAGRDLWIVNVHATKPFWLEDGLEAMVTRIPKDVRWHRDEHERLGAWLDERAEVPVVVAGDFNAPHYAYNLRLPGLHLAHLEAGRGPHVTFPAALPVWGIDHALGNSHVRFSEYRILEAGPSDHRAQLARFQIVGGAEAGASTRRTDLGLLIPRSK